MIFVLLISLGSYTHWFTSGRPVVTDEYLVKFNQLGQSELPASDNAWPHYEKAFAAFVEPGEELKETFAFRNDSPFKFPGLAVISDKERKAIIEWVAANESAWDHFERAGNCSCCYRQRCYDRDLQSAQLLLNVTVSPSLRHIRDFAKVGIWKARLAAEEGRLDECIDDCLVIARVASHWQKNPCLIEQLVGVACGALARSELLRIVSEHDLSAATLRDIQTMLVELYPDGFPLANFEGERLVILDAVQHTFTESGFGGGHLIPGQYESVLVFTVMPKGARPTMRTRLAFRVIDIALTMVHAGRDKTVTKINEVYDEIGRRSRLSPYQRHVSGEKEIAESIGLYRYGFVLMLFPAESRVSELAFRSYADHQATLTILALKRFCRDAGAYPPDLQSLVDAEYLPLVPTDPYSDGPLIYRHVGGDLLLYSVGPDFVDGGGHRGVDDEGQPRIWAENGDRVFWPLGGAVE